MSRTYLLFKVGLQERSPGGRPLARALVGAGLALAAALSASAPAAALDFVRRQGTDFAVGSQIYRVAGSNHHYIHYAPASEVTNGIGDAQALHLNTLRITANLVIGSLDGTPWADPPSGQTVPTVWNPASGANAWDLNPAGVYFQYWDTATGAPAFNDGATGLRHLDYAIWQAGQRGIRLIVILTDNWGFLGGVPQYLKWYGIDDSESTHDEFFSDARFKNAYKVWVAHLLDRVNYYTGVAYKDDPTILGWDLCNECQTAQNAPLLTGWIAEMSAYVKSLDTHHLVGAGDEGAFNRGGDDDSYNGWLGQDFDAVLALPNIDYGTFHAYPEYFYDSASGDPEPNEWATARFIPDHYAAGAVVGKPVVMEEFGMTAGGKPAWYEEWTRRIESLRGAGWAVWATAGHMANNAYPTDYEGFQIRLGTTVAATVTAAADRLHSSATDLELLANPGFEHGTSGWFPGDAMIAATAGAKRTGTYGCKVSSRAYTWGSAMQEVTAALLTSGQGTYNLSGWVRLASGLDSANLTLKLVDDAGERYLTLPTVGFSFWAQAAGSLPLTWTGTLQGAYLYLETGHTKGTLYLDDFSLKRQ